MSEWKIIEKEDISPSKWRRMERWKVQTHKNKEEDVFISLLGDSAVVFGLTDENKVLLLTQYCIGPQEYLKTFVAGFVDGNNSVEETIKHELQEEAGCSAREIIYLGNSHRSKWSVGKVHFYLAKGVIQNLEQELEGLEDISVEFISLEELEKLLDENKIHDIASATCAEKALRYLINNS